MSKHLSRRDFLKGAAASFAGVAAMGVLGACSNETGTTTAAPETTAAGTTAAPETTAAPAGLYIPGTYSAKAQGIGTVIVTMTFDANNITDVVLDVSGETANYGQAAAEDLRNAILNAQSAEIDGVAGATLSSNAVRQAAAKCIQQAKGEIPVEVIDNTAKADEPANWLGAAPEIDEAMISETWETDLLIVGAGNGGCCAGAYAASKGYNFRLIEKMGTFGKVRGWYGAVDSVDILASGEKPVDRARLRNELQRFASGKINMSATNTWINESAAMHDFIKSLYATYSPEATLTVTVGEEASWPEPEKSGFFFPAIEHTWSRAMNRNEMFQTYMSDKGYTIDYNTALVKLEKDGERVTGAIAQNTTTGAYIRINAANGVILATGGYSGNADMMQQLDPIGSAVTTANVGNPQNTGDGIKAAMWAGASMQAEPAPMLFDRGIVAPGVDAGYITLENGSKVFPSNEAQFGLGSQPFLKVNRRGERFANESGTYDHISYASYNQPGQVYAAIFDNGMTEDVVRFHTIGCSANTRKNAQGRLDSFIKKADSGLTFVADTLEELADKMGFVGEAKTTFLATCDRYNELYDMGEDVDFGKPFYRMSELRKPPFYGFWMGACLLTTEQGVLVDANAQVLDENRNPMPGLYGAGDATGGFFVNNYPCLMPGAACGKAMTFGIKAVKSAMGEEA